MLLLPKGGPVGMVNEEEGKRPKRSLFGFFRGEASAEAGEESDFARLRSQQQARREEASDADRRMAMEAAADRHGRIDQLGESLRETALQVLEEETRSQGDEGGCELVLVVDEDMLIHTFTKAALGDEQGDIALVDALNGAEEHRLDLHRNWTSVLAATRDGGHVASGSLDRQVSLLSAVNAEPLGTIELEDPVSALAFSDDGQFLATGTSAGQMAVHNLEDGTVVCRSSHEKRVAKLAFSHDGRFLAVGAPSLDGAQPTVRVLSLPDGEERHRFDHGTVIDALAFSSDASHLALGGLDPTSLLVGLEDASSMSIDVVTGSKVLAMSPAEGLLVSGGRDGWLRLIEMDGTLRFSEPFEGSLLDVAFSGDGEEIGIGYDDGRLEVRSGKDGRVLRTVECSTDMKPISLVLLRGQRLHDDVVAALKPVLAEIESGGFVVDVPHVRANGEVWEAAMAVKWSWG